nr:hypothetical protein [Candidatus Cloacimonadota bacterium]
MRKITLFVFVFMIFSLSAIEQTWNFDQPDSSLIFYQYGKHYEPLIDHNICYLLAGHRQDHQKNVVVFPKLDNKKYADVELDWNMFITLGAEGCGVAFLNSDIFSADSLNLNLDKWQEPNIEGSFAVGFDICDPPTTLWFGSDGNFYDRPQREISLHWNGKEIKKILSPVEFRSDYEADDFKKFYLKIHQVIGGSEITLKIEDEIVFDKFFIAEMQSYPVRLAMGGQTSEQTTSLLLGDIHLKFINKAIEMKQPIHVQAVDKQAIFVDFRETQHQVVFPEFQDQIGRVIMSLEM